MNGLDSKRERPICPFAATIMAGRGIQNTDLPGKLEVVPAEPSISRIVTLPVIT